MSLLVFRRIRRLFRNESVVAISLEPQLLGEFPNLIRAPYPEEQELSNYGG